MRTDNPACAVALVTLSQPCNPLCHHPLLHRTEPRELGFLLLKGGFVSENVLASRSLLRLVVGLGQRLAHPLPDAHVTYL